MKLKTNSKGDYTSEWVYFLVGASLVILGLLIMLSMSNKEKENNYQQVASLKEGYQTIQLARTFLQTPMLFNGETKEVAQWANEYFNIDDLSKKDELRRAMHDLAELTIKPHMQTNFFDSEASFTYYFLGVEKGKLIVASTGDENSKNLQDKNVIYSDKEQTNVSMQIPFYEKGEQFNPTDKYILFEIKTTNQQHQNLKYNINMRGR